MLLSLFIDDLSFREAFLPNKFDMLPLTDPLAERGGGRQLPNTLVDGDNGMIKPSSLLHTVRGQAQYIHNSEEGGLFP